MTTATPRPLRRRLQARFMRLVNVPMRVVLGLPLRTPLAGRLMLLTYRGRRTGRVYRQPLSYVRYEDTLLTPGGGSWTLSLSPERSETVRLAGRDLLLTPELVSDLDQVQQLILVMATTNPTIHRFIAIPRRPDGTLEPVVLQNALDHGFCIVRWHHA
jgi:hypothetical protein